MIGSVSEPASGTTAVLEDKHDAREIRFKTFEA